MIEMINEEGDNNKLPDLYVQQFAEMFKVGNFESIIEEAKHIQSIYPKSSELFNFLASSQARIGLRQEANANYDKAFQLNSENYDLASNYGLFLMEGSELESAQLILKKAVSIKPDSPEANNNLGVCYRMQGESESARKCFEAAIKCDKAFLKAKYNLALIDADERNYENALNGLKEILRTSGFFVDAWISLGNVYTSLEKFSEARISYEKALTIDPQSRGFRINLAMIYSLQGEHAKAAALFEEAVQIGEDSDKALAALAAHFHVDEAGLTELKQKISDPYTSHDEKRRIYYSLGNIYEDKQNYAEAYQNFTLGNILRKQTSPFNLNSAAALHHVIKKSLIGEPMDPIQFSVPLDKQPIFVVGMPRSGTTLVEQILASHSSVHGAGELEVCGEIVTKVFHDFKDRQEDSFQFPHSEMVRRHLGEKYRKIGFPEKYVVDKNPLNYRWTGYLLESIPNVKVIQMDRAPMATIWSCFKQNFSSEGTAAMTTDVRVIAHLYKMFSDLMSFFRHRYPDKIYVLDYEKLTEDQETETKKLLDFCGLDWEADCLKFYNNNNFVKTASALQVKKKMYTGSSEAWKSYRQYLQPVENWLEENGLMKKN